MKVAPLPPKKRKPKPKPEKKNRVGAPNKPPELVKIPVGLKLPRWLLRWMHEQEEPMSIMIEEALCEKHGLVPPTFD